MPDFGIGETIAALAATAGDTLGSLGAIGGTEAAMGGAEAAAAGGAAAGAPLSILPEAAAFTPTGVGEIMGAGANALGSGLALEPGFAGAMEGIGLGGAGNLLPSGATPASGSAAGVPGTQGAFTPNALDNVAMGSTPSGTAIATPPSGASGAPIDLTSLTHEGANAADVGALGQTAGAAQGAGPATGAASTATQSGGSFLDKLVGGATSSLTKNPLGTAAAGLGLGMNLMNAGKQPGADSIAQMKSIASNLASQQQAMRSYLDSGTLPPGLQASMDQAKAAARARAVSNAAAQGLPTDPTQNTALAQQFNAIDQQAMVSQGQIANSLMQTGVNEAQLTDSIYNQLVAIDQTQSKQVGDAITNFAKALGGGGGVQLKLA